MVVERWPKIVCSAMAQERKSQERKPNSPCRPLDLLYVRAVAVWEAGL